MDFCASGIAWAFARDLFNFTLTRRLSFIALLSQNNTETKKSPFSSYIGKAVLLKLYDHQEGFRQKFRRDFPQCVTNLQAFSRYIIECCYWFSRHESSIFEGVLLMSAFLIEITAYCYECGVRNYFHRMPIFWAGIFHNTYSVKFFLDGGWTQLNYHAFPLSQSYDYIGVETYCDDFCNWYDATWLLHTDEKPEEHELMYKIQKPLRTFYAIFSEQAEEDSSGACWKMVPNTASLPSMFPLQIYYAIDNRNVLSLPNANTSGSSSLQDIYSGSLNTSSNKLHNSLETLTKGDETLTTVNTLQIVEMDDSSFPMKTPLQFPLCSRD